jgi:hypothetical protein
MKGDFRLVEVGLRSGHGIGKALSGVERRGGQDPVGRLKDEPSNFAAQNAGNFAACVKYQWSRFWLSLVRGNPIEST